MIPVRRTSGYNIQSLEAIEYMIGIRAYGAYIPKYLVKREDIAHAWDFPSIPGTKAVANADEDSLTMGVEAGLDCIATIDPKSIDALLFASTTSPYLEKSSASIIAAALDMRKDILTQDFGNSLKSCTTALITAFNMVKAGQARNVLVIASDMRNPEPITMYEYAFGDAAAALLVSSEDLGLELVDHVSTSEELVGPWRRAKDDYVRQMSGKYDDIAGYGANMIKAIKALLAKTGTDPVTVTKACIYGADLRAPGGIAKRVGLNQKSTQDTLFMTLGDTGNAQVFMTMIASLKRAKDGEIVLLGGYGDGADAILMKVVSKDKMKELKRTRRAHIIYSAMTEVVNNYGKYLFFRNALKKEPFKRKTSTVTIHRDGDFLLRMHGVKCKKCGTIQYPKWRSCIEPACQATGQMEDVKLAKKGKIFTFTLDHLEGGDYYETPVPRCVIDLDGGGRILLNMTECNPSDVAIGMDVEMTFRKIHEGAEFYNYYWKCRPIRSRVGTEED